MIVMEVVGYEREEKKMMELLDKIEKIRRDNNKHWMNILRLAFLSLIHI